MFNQYNYHIINRIENPMYAIVDIKKAGNMPKEN